ncbi:hypothetical protein J2W23_005850 [Variovorax boronicumulans]|uniref:hypothetical protein n=1 Tax=Variovorax boronicumulans TaxID=436515 RepID=UPI00159DCBE6|nr:hypothetical protein [Variovorax boronicumulans]MDQ0017437.1 hypothetical protein [Variovorax boronicumulans]
MNSRHVVWWVSGVSMAMLLVGGLFFAGVDQPSPTAYAVFAAALGVIVVSSILLSYLLVVSKRRKPVVHETLPARVLDARSNNTMVLNQYLIWLTVEFVEADGTRRQLKVEQAVDLIDMAGYARGREVLLHRGSSGGKPVVWVSQPDPFVDKGAAV